MCKIIQFSKEYKEQEEIAADMDKLYEEYYSNPENYVLDPEEYREGIDYKVVNGKIVSLW